MTSTLMATAALTLALLAPHGAAQARSNHAPTAKAASGHGVQSPVGAKAAKKSHATQKAGKHAKKAGKKAKAA
jgi:hypothetical protein